MGKGGGRMRGRVHCRREGILWKGVLREGGSMYPYYVRTRFSKQFVEVDGVSGLLLPHHHHGGGAVDGLVLFEPRARLLVFHCSGVKGGLWDVKG